MYINKKEKFAYAGRKRVLSKNQSTYVVAIFKENKSKGQVFKNEKEIKKIYWNAVEK